MITNKSSYEKYVREQLNNNQNKRLDDIIKKYGLKYSDSFSELIVLFSNIEERASVESPFIIEQAKLKFESYVFDACLGSGSTSIGLKQHGISKIVSNEIDTSLANYSSEQAKQRGISLDITPYDWRELDAHFKNEFDAVCCLGNSLTYIFNAEEQQKVVNNFASILKPEGYLIIDIRNYTELLRGNFQNNSKGPYRAFDKISLEPIYSSPDMAILRYAHKAKAIEHDLILYPFKDGEIESLISGSGMVLKKTFGDYKENYDSKTVDYYTFIAQKPE